MHPARIISGLVVKSLVNKNTIPSGGSCEKGRKLGKLLADLTWFRYTEPVVFASVNVASPFREEAQRRARDLEKGSGRLLVLASDAFEQPDFPIQQSEEKAYGL